MSRELLDRAYNLIVDEQYLEARAILIDLEPQSSTARRWLANLDDLLQQQNVPMEEDEDDTLPVVPEPEPQPLLESDPEPQPQDTFDARPLVETSEPAPESVGEVDSAPAIDSRPLAEDPGAVMQLSPDAVEEPRVHTLLAERAPEIPLDEGFPMVAQSATEDMPIIEPSDLIPVGVEAPVSTEGSGWEYREIVVKTWQQHMSNIEYALEQGGEKITIEDAYVKLLNETGAQGWEVVREEVLPQQYVRLLMKRRTR